MNKSSYGYLIVAVTMAMCAHTAGYAQAPGGQYGAGQNDAFNQARTLGERAHAQGDFNTAIRYYQQLMKMQPDNPKWPNRIAIIYLRQNQFDQARPYLVATLKCANSDRVSQDLKANARENLSYLDGANGNANRRQMDIDGAKESKDRGVASPEDALLSGYTHAHKMTVQEMTLDQARREQAGRDYGVPASQINSSTLQPKW